jgi:hypothetical protein
VVNTKNINAFFAMMNITINEAIFATSIIKFFKQHFIKKHGIFIPLSLLKKAQIID